MEHLPLTYLNILDGTGNKSYSVCVPGYLFIQFVTHFVWKEAALSLDVILEKANKELET